MTDERISPELSEVLRQAKQEVESWEPWQLTNVDPFGERPMTDQQKVKQRYPNARVRSGISARYFIETGIGANIIVLSEFFNTPDEAWADAARRNEEQDGKA